MRTVKFILVAIFAVLIGIVLFANGDDVIVYLWPDMTDYGLPAPLSYQMPIGAFAFLAGVVGFILGLFGEWLREGSLRSDRRKTLKEAQALKAKIDELTQDAGDDDIPALSAR